MPDGYHAFFSDGFYQQGTTAAPNTGVDMRTWDGVAFLCLDGTTLATMQMADDSAFTVNLTTVVEADHGNSVTMPAGSTPPFWLEIWRPTRRYVRVSGATGVVLAFQYRHTGTMPRVPAPNRSGGRGS